MDAEIIVIGAGIAGLTAAWYLNQAGKKVIVLEAAAAVGGRMCSENFAESIIDGGAQFLSSAYTVIPELIQQTGMQKEFVETSSLVGLANDKQIFQFNIDKPWSVFKSKVLPLFDLIRLGIQHYRFYPLRSLSLNDYSQWSKFDYFSANQWANKYFGHRVANQITASILDGFFFQSISESSAALAMAVATFQSHQSKTMTLINGIGSLPQTIASYLNVRCNARVKCIREEAAALIVETNENVYKTKHVVLAVTAPEAKKILPNPDPVTEYLLNTIYSSSANLIFVTMPEWEPPKAIAKTYGLLKVPDATNKIAAITLENNKHPDRCKHGHAVNIMLSGHYANQLLQLSDEEIFKSVKKEIEFILPGIYNALYAKKIYRWPLAMPSSPIGRAAQIKAYRASRTKHHRILLAGDYLGFPWTDSAAATGKWAAQQIINSD